MPGTLSNPRVVPGTGAMVGSPLPAVPPSLFIALIKELFPAGQDTQTHMYININTHTHMDQHMQTHFPSKQTSKQASKQTHTYMIITF
jgi:hypothetical protein